MPDLELGFEGENRVRTVRIDVGELLALVPGASVALSVRRPGERSRYLVVPQVEGGVALWTVTRESVGFAGYGDVQAIATLGEQEARSAVMPYHVSQSAPGTVQDTPPAVDADWVAQVLGAAERAEDAAERAEAAGGTGGGSAVGYSVVDGMICVTYDDERSGV